MKNTDRQGLGQSRGHTYNQTDGIGNYCQDVVDDAGMLAAPIRLQQVMMLTCYVSRATQQSYCVSCGDPSALQTLCTALTPAISCLQLPSASARFVSWLVTRRMLVSANYIRDTPTKLLMKHSLCSRLCGNSYHTYLFISRTSARETRFGATSATDPLKVSV